MQKYLTLQMNMGYYCFIHIPLYALFPTHQGVIYLFLFINSHIVLCAKSVLSAL